MSDSRQPDTSGPIIIASNPSLSFQTMNRNWKVYSLNDAELDALASEHGSLDLTFFGLSCGSLLTTSTTLATVSIADTKAFAVMVACTILFLFLAFFFGIRCYLKRKAANLLIEKIRDGK